MDLHEVYSWKAYYKNGEVKCGGELVKKDLVKFILVPHVPYLGKIIIKLDESKELVYFKRVFCSFPHNVYNILYCVGYNDKIIWINSITGEITL